VRMGHVGHARQPGRGHADLVGRCRRHTGARAGAEDAGDRFAAARAGRALSVGRPPRAHDAAAGDRRDRQQRYHAGLHQHALAIGDLVPGPARSAARMGGCHRLAPRLARPRGARVGRAGAEERRAACGGVHIEPRSRCRLPAGRACAADRFTEGRGALASARGPLGPCAGPTVAHHARPDAQHRDGGSCGGTRGHRGGAHRSAPLARAAARCAGAAPRHRGAGRRLRARRSVRRSANHGGVREHLARKLGMVLVVRAPGRPLARGLPRLPTRRAR